MHTTSANGKILTHKNISQEMIKHTRSTGMQLASEQDVQEIAGVTLPTFVKSS